MPRSADEEAIAILDSALAVAEHHVVNVSRDKSRWKDLRVQILHDRALRHEASDDAERAMQDAQRAMQLLDENVDAQTQRHVRLLFGRRLMEQGAVDAALQQFTSLWSELPPDADPLTTGIVAGNIATCVHNLRHYDDARHWFQIAEEAFTSAQHHDKRALALRGVGMAYSKMGKYDEAFEEYDKALSALDLAHPTPVRQLLSIRENIGVDHLNVADVTHKQSHYKKALFHFQGCLELARQHHIGFGLIVANRNLGLVYAEERFNGHSLAKAREYLEESLRLARSAGLRLLEGQVLRDLSPVLECCNEPTMALEALREWHRIESEIISTKAEERVRELELQLATQQANADRSRAEQYAADLSEEVERHRRSVTSITMAIGQKNAALHETRNRLRELADETSDAHVQKELRILARKLELSENSDAYWEGLEEQLSQIHPGVVEILAVRHPNLTPTERRVCALIRHDLSTKDIARLLGTEPRSVEKYRQRIRKKLSLDPSTNLNVYLTSL